MVVVMNPVDLAGANDDDVVAAPLLNGHYEDLLSDFRRRMATALKVLREYEDAVRQGDYF
jgi:hypothetical protein